MSVFFVVSRFILALIYTVFGFMGLAMILGWMPQQNPAMPEKAMLFMQGIVATGYFLPFLKITETLAGALLFFKRLSPLALIILAPITLNIFLMHVFLTPELASLILPIIMVSCHVLAMLGFAQKYKTLWTV